MMFRSRVSPAGYRAAAFAIATMTAAAAGQAQPSPQQAEVLSGPKVRGRDVPGVEGRFGGEPAGPQRARRALPARVFEQALETLRDPEAPAELRLSPEQDGKISEIMEGYRAEVRAYLQEHRGEFDGADRQELRRAVREGRRPGPRNPPPPGEAGEPMDGERPIRDRIAEIRENMPKFGDWQVKIWAELNEPQREAVERRLAETRRQVEERMGEEYVQRRVRARQGQAPGGAGATDRSPPPPEGRGGRGPGGPETGVPAPARQRVRRIVEQLGQLPPEERDRILSRLEDELARRAELRERREGERRTAPRDPQ